jgi:hypothetical protein
LDKSSFIISNIGKLELKPDLLTNNVDPIMLSLLDTIANAMIDKAIYFLYDEIDNYILINDKRNNNKLNDNNKNRQIIVPVALYEVQNIDFNDINNNNNDNAKNNRNINYMDNNIDNYNDIENYFLWNDSTVACISKGNVIYYQLSSLPKKYSKWNCCRVVSIDLLFARLRVVACPPPPYCWYPHHTLAPTWIDVSLLWGKSVASLLPADDTDTIKYSRYIFIRSFSIYINIFQF